MVMPKATMHENHSMVLRKDNIRFSGEIRLVESETKAIGMESRANKFLRLCVDTSNMTHIQAALGRSQNVHRVSSVCLIVCINVFLGALRAAGGGTSLAVCSYGFVPSSSTAMLCSSRPFTRATTF